MLLRKILLIILFFIGFSAKVTAQDTLTSLKPIFEFIGFKKDSIYNPNEVHTLPKFPGGDSTLFEYLKIGHNRHIAYRWSQYIKGNYGKVIINFIVTSTGYVDSVTVEKGIHPILDLACVRTVMEMPNWTPATLNGIAVSCRHTVPFSFSIDTELKSDMRPDPLIRVIKDINAKDYESAIKRADKELSKDRRQAAYIAYKGLAYFNLKDAERACFYFQSAIDVGKKFGFRDGITEEGLKELISKYCTPKIEEK